VGFTQGRPIDLGLYFNDERKVAALGIAADGPVDFDSDSEDETKVSIDIVPKMKRKPNATRL